MISKIIITALVLNYCPMAFGSAGFSSLGLLENKTVREHLCEQGRIFTASLEQESAYEFQMGDSLSGVPLDQIQSLAQAYEEEISLGSSLYRSVFGGEAVIRDDKRASAYVLLGISQWGKKVIKDQVSLENTHFFSLESPEKNLWYRSLVKKGAQSLIESLIGQEARVFRLTQSQTLEDVKESLCEKNDQEIKIQEEDSLSKLAALTRFVENLSTLEDKSLRNRGLLIFALYANDPMEKEKAIQRSIEEAQENLMVALEKATTSEEAMDLILDLVHGISMGDLYGQKDFREPKKAAYELFSVRQSMVPLLVQFLITKNPDLSQKEATAQAESLLQEKNATYSGIMEAFTCQEDGNFVINPDAWYWGECVFDWSQSKTILQKLVAQKITLFPF
jgi:hypothetical protein